MYSYTFPTLSPESCFCKSKIIMFLNNIQGIPSVIFVTKTKVRVHKVSLTPRNFRSLDYGKGEK